MEFVSTPKRYGPAGPADVSVVGKALNVTMLNPDTLAPSGDKFTAGLGDLPIEGITKITSGRYYVQLSPDKSKIAAFRPWNATVVCRFTGFAGGGVGSLPVPKHFSGTRKRKDGTSFPVDEQTFTALLEVTEGPYAKFIIPCTFTYLSRDPENPEYFTGFIRTSEGDVGITTSKRKAVQKLAAFLEAGGIWGKGRKISWSDNILPALQEALLEEGKLIMVVIKNGWAETFADTYITTPKAKSPKAKSKK